MYISVSTLPDIAYGVRSLAQFLSKPTTAHWKAVKHLFCYLKGTLEQGILTKNNQVLLQVTQVQTGQVM